MITPIQLGERLTAQRTRLRLDAKWVAEKSGLDAERLQQIESGTRPPTVSELWRMGAALGIDPALLLDQEERIDRVRSTARFLSAAEALDPLDVRLLRVAAELSRVGGWLQERLDRPCLLPGTATPLTGTHPGEQGYQLGRSARDTLRLPDGPIPSVSGWLKDSGVHVCLLPFASPGIIAASLREPGATPMILLNQKAHRNQRSRARRSVLAHELCHLLHDLEPAHTLAMVTRSNAREEDQEQRANGFAPSFLAPSPQLAAHRDPLALARHLVDDWWLSADAASWYACNLTDRSQTEAPGLRRHLKMCGDPPDEPPLPDGRLADGLIGNLADEAGEKNLITAARVAEIRRTS